MVDLKKLLLEGLSIWRVQAIIRTDSHINKNEIFNQIRALSGVIVLEVESSEYLNKQKTTQFEYSLIYFKFIARDNPSDELAEIVSSALQSENKIRGLRQFVPRVKTLKQIGKIK
jgi:hypothetical protein